MLSQAVIVNIAEDEACVEARGWDGRSMEWHFSQGVSSMSEVFEG